MQQVFFRGLGKERLVAAVGGAAASVGPSQTKKIDFLCSEAIVSLSKLDGRDDLIRNTPLLRAHISQHN